MNDLQPRVVFLDAATYGGISLESFEQKWPCRIYATTAPAETESRLAGHNVVVTNKVVLGSQLFQSRNAEALKLIAVAATGTDIIDKEAARERGIAVCNVPGYATQSVAQMTIALILELTCRVGRYAEQVRAGEWERSPVFSMITQPTMELCGKRLGIVGWGNIGRAVAQMAASLGLDIMVSGRPGVSGNVPPGRVSWEEVMGSADIISLHCPLTSDTRGLIHDRSLGRMKRTAFLINTARGGLVDEGALIRALRARRIAGAALDVISCEPPMGDVEIIAAARELDNLVITPHVAWSARETRERLMVEVAMNIEAYFRGERRNRCEG